MKTIITFTLLFVCTFTAQSQDLIILKSGEEIEARVQEVGTDIVKYKKFDHQNGPDYTIGKSKIFMIRYENGSRDLFNDEEQPANAPQTSVAPTGNDPLLPGSSLNINPLGLLQLGPIIQYEAKLSPNSVIVPYFRYAYLGVVTHAIWTGFDEGELSPATFALGIGVKGYAEETGNSLYYGGFLDYNVAKANYSIGEIWETQEKYSGLAFVSNVGYQWRRSSGNYINLGIFAGANFTLNSEEYYVYSGEILESDNSTTIFAMLELAFGFGL